MLILLFQIDVYDKISGAKRTQILAPIGKESSNPLPIYCKTKNTQGIKSLDDKQKRLYEAYRRSKSC